MYSELKRWLNIEKNIFFHLRKKQNVFENILENKQKGAEMMEENLDC